MVFSPPAKKASSKVVAEKTPWLSNEDRQGWRVISLPFLYALLLLLAPILVVIANSFWSQDYLTIIHEFTLKNYKEALFTPIYQDLLIRSLWVSVAVSIITVVFSYPIAYFISFYGGNLKSLWIFVITVPFWSGYLLRIMSWKVLLGYNGVLNSGLTWSGILDEPYTGLLYNLNGVLIALSHSWAAFAILPIFISLNKIDRSLLEAAADLGDNGFRRFWRVILPLSLPGVIAALLIVMIPTVGDYVTPKLIGGKDGVMIATAIQAQFGKVGNWPLGAALSITTMVAVGLCAGAMVLIVNGLRKFMK